MASNNSRVLFYWHRLTLITHGLSHGLVITFPIKCGIKHISIPKLQLLHFWSLGIDKLFHSTLYGGCNYLSLLRFKLIHGCKRGSRCPGAFCQNICLNEKESQMAKSMGPTWGPPGSYQPQMGPMLAPWTMLSGMCIWNMEVLSWFCSTRKLFDG